MSGHYIYGAVEGPVDEAVLDRLVAHAGHSLVSIYVPGGKSALLDNLPAYNRAAKLAPWVILIDLDRDHPCAPPAVEEWLPSPARYMTFRIAVRTAEAWLLADRARFARFLGVSASKVPVYPEQLDDPKQVVINLARNSSKSYIREELVPAEGSGRKVGALYSSRIIEFIQSIWDPIEAAGRSDSLDRCVRHLTTLEGP